MEAETTTPNSIVFIGNDREENDEVVEEEQWKAKMDEEKGQIKKNVMMEMDEGNMNSRNKKRWKNSTETTMIPSSTISSNNEEDQNNNNKIEGEEKADEAKAATTTILVIEEENVDTDSGKNVVEETKKGEENCDEILAIKNNNKIAVMAELRRAVELEETEILMMNGNGGQEEGGRGGGVRKSINEMKRSANMKKRMEARKQHQQSKIPIPALQREWLEQLRHSGAELETMTVLYAKSVLNNESISKNGGRKGQQHLDRVPICPHQPATNQQCQHKQLAMPSISRQNCPPLTYENVAPESRNGGQQFGRLRVTRIDKTDNNEQQHYEEGGGEKWNNGNDNGELFRSTVCIFDSGGGGESIANNSDFPLAQSLVMNRSSRVEIDARKWPTKSSNGTLNKFAQSLPNGHGLAQRLATMNDGIDEWEEEEDWENGRQRRDEFDGIGNGNKIAGGEMAIYRPAIRYRRKCQQNGNNNGREHHRRKAGAAGNCSQFCHSNPNFPPFRHSIRVNIEGNDCGEHSHQNEHKNDTGSFVAPIYGHHFYSSNPNLVHPTSSSIHHSSYLPPPSSPPPLPPASSSDSGQGSAGTSPPFCAANAKSTQMLIGGQRRGAILMMENSSSSLADDDSSAEEYFDDDTCIGGPSKIASRRRQQWPMGNGNAIGNFGGIRQQPPPLPSYARTASTIDQALRLSSTIFAHFSFANPSMTKSSVDGISAKKLAETCATFIQLVQTSPCAQQMPKANIELVRRAISDLEKTTTKKDANRKEEEEIDGHNWDDDYLAVRQMAEGCMLQFCKVLCQYLGQCSPEDRLLPIALEQFIHLLLFGDEFCVDAIRLDAVDNLLAIGQCWPKNGQICCPPATLKLILRALAVLCGTAKGCLQLLSMGGFDFVMKCLMMEDGDTKKHSPHGNDNESSMMAVAYEAAGCLAQLSNPSHPFVRPPRPAGPLVQRLLQLADAALQPESLLLCMAALANLTAQSPAALCEQLYVNNAILRLIRAAQLSTKANTQNPFVQEQLVTILTRMANRGHQLALIAQGAIPALCKMLGPIKATGRMADLERRIVYKAAICLGFLASNGVGLKALNEQKVYPVLLEISRNENKQCSMTPVQLICASIRQKLESTFQPQLETAV